MDKTTEVKTNLKNSLNVKVDDALTDAAIEAFRTSDMKIESKDVNATSAVCMAEQTNAPTKCCKACVTTNSSQDTDYNRRLQNEANRASRTYSGE